MRKHQIVLGPPISFETHGHISNLVIVDLQLPDLSTFKIRKPKRELSDKFCFDWGFNQIRTYIATTIGYEGEEEEVFEEVDDSAAYKFPKIEFPENVSPEALRRYDPFPSLLFCLASPVLKTCLPASPLPYRIQNLSCAGAVPTSFPSKTMVLLEFLVLNSFF